MFWYPVGREGLIKQEDGMEKEASGGSGKLVEARACSGDYLKQNTTHIWFRNPREEEKM